MEVGIEFHDAGELQLKVRRPKSLDKYGTCRSFWVEERRACDNLMEEIIKWHLAHTYLVDPVTFHSDVSNVLRQT